MPYPLPDEGPPYTAGLRWFLVAVPDDVAFVRAAMGAYTELASYWKWGLEGREPGRQDAAELWQGAIDATLEALEMGFPDILLGHIDGVEALLRQIRDRPCCGGGATDTIPNPGEGGGGIAPVGSDDQVPDYTDDTDIITAPPQTVYTDADEDTETTGPEMVEYLCAAAHWYYDLLHRWLSFMKLYSTLGGLVWEPVSAIINIVVSKYGGTNPIATIAAEAADQLVNLWPEVNSAMVDAIIAELEANRDDIICAIAVERNLAGMISAVYSQLQTITTALGYLNMLPMVSYPVFAMALVSQGLIDLSDVEGSCDCEGGGQLLLEWNFEDSIEGWTSGQWDSVNGYPEAGAFYTSQKAFKTVLENEHNLPLSGTVTIKCYAKNYSSIANGTITVEAQLDLGAGALLEEQTPQNLGAGWAEYQFGPATFELSRLDRGLFIEFTCTGVLTEFAYIDNIRIYVEPS